MKTPFPAFYFQPALHPRLPTIWVRPCEVVTTLPQSKKAVIRLHSLVQCGYVEKVVDFADLASTPEKAAEEFARRFVALPVAQFSRSPEKSAAAEVAGGGVESKGEAQ
ncbi:MAG TPA: hypothetical protein VEB66_02390 [Opitutaceae bacterium]|nr:hypothetical protein [Opitutaceae bacterium]